MEQENWLSIQQAWAAVGYRSSPDYIRRLATKYNKIVWRRRNFSREVLVLVGSLEKYLDERNFPERTPEELASLETGDA